MTERSLQRAREADVEELSEIDMELFGEEGFSESTFRRELRVGTCFVIRQDDLILGYAHVRSDDGIHDLMRLGVRAHVQAQGLGRALLRAARKELPGKMMLLVRKVNRGARRLYESEGFSVEGTLNDSWLMVG